MAKSSDYRSLASPINSALLKARLLRDVKLMAALTTALDRAVSIAVKLKKAEEEKKAGA